mgnify:CR=1 FL=1
MPPTAGASHHAPMKRVLFLCTGNYYRSRYAEELFNHLARAENLPWRALSRGAAERGSPDNVGAMSVFADRRLRASGIVPEGATRYPQPCSLEAFFGRSGTRPLVERRFPEVAERVTYWHVHDIDVADPAVALPMIDDLVRGLVSSLS